MNAARVQQDIAAAQRKFDYLEAHWDTSGQLYALAALQTARQTYTLLINFPGYPNEAPKVWVRKPTLAPSKHRYPDNQICYIHPNRWNPGLHDVEFVIARSAKWLHKYEVYRSTGRWPGAGIEH